MSYIPPHKRQMSSKNAKVPEKKYEHFPELTKINTQVKNKMDYSILFKKVIQKREKKKEEIPYG